MKKNICIVTFYDAPFRNAGNLAWNAMKRYADAQGYDAIRFQDRTTERPPAWEKLRCIDEAFSKGYAFVLWIDADAMVMDLESGIESVIREGKDLYMVAHDVGGMKSPNTGVMLLRNSEITRQSLSDIWNMDQFANHRWWEQAAMLEYFGLTAGLPENERRYFDGYAAGGKGDASIIEWIDEKWNFIPGISNGKAAIRHYAGKRWFERLDGMTRDAFSGGSMKGVGIIFRCRCAVLWIVARARLMASRAFQKAVRMK